MKKLLVIAGVLLLGIAIFIFKKPLAKKESEFDIATVKKGELVNKVSASGVIEAEEEVDLKFQTSGRLTWVGVKEGDWVKKWQAIAQLDTQELQKNLEKTLRDYASERWDFEQEREDYNVGSDSLNRYTLANEVRRILEKNQFDLDKAVIDVELKDITLKYATLVTPIAGIVTHIDTPVAGVNLTPATAVFTVSNPDPVYFSVNIDEADIGKVRLGQKAKIILDSYPDLELESEIWQITFKAIKTSGGGTAFPAKIRLPKNENQKFKLGMNGDAEIIIEKKENTLFVPLEAVVERNKKRYVWLVENGKAVKREVEVGLETDDEMEILEGVKKGDKVISKGVSKIKEGQKIK